MSPLPRLRTLLGLSLIAIGAGASVVRAQESTRADQPAPSSLEDHEWRFGEGADRFARKKPLFRWCREWTKEAAPFFCDTELSDQGLEAYRQRLELPYVNGRDNRAVPNTFEAYAAGGRTRYDYRVIVNYEIPIL